jgi:hypothetical protein
LEVWTEFIIENRISTSKLPQELNLVQIIKEPYTEEDKRSRGVALHGYIIAAKKNYVSNGVGIGGKLEDMARKLDVVHLHHVGFSHHVVPPFFLLFFLS